MTRHLVVALAAVISGVTALALPSRICAAQPDVSPRADTLDLLILGRTAAARLELRVEIDDRSVPAAWDETFAMLLKFHDRNGDGSLDRTEAGRLPTPFVLRQALWGTFTPPTNSVPPVDQLDLNADGKVQVDELSDFYRRAGLGGALVGLGQPSGSEQLTNALLLRLDVNKNNQVDELEWRSAAETLRLLDQNDDELIGPGELVEKAAYPGALGAMLLSSQNPALKLPPAIESLPLKVLPLRLADQHWVDAVRASRPENNDVAFSAETLTSLRTAKPAGTWHVTLRAQKPNTEQRSLQVAGQEPPSNSRLAFASDLVHLELRTDEGKLPEQSEAALKRVAALFGECDTNSDGTLDEQELNAPRAAQIQPLALIADRNNNGQWDGKELAAWIELQKQVANSHVLLTLIDRGPGLFEVLDVEHDGALSARELKSAWARLNAAGVIVDGTLDRTKLPRQILATVSRGHPLSTIGSPVYQAPDWFRAMDRNGDGDLSRREFTGSTQIFDRLDQDKDGLIGSEEAATARLK